METNVLIEKIEKLPAPLKKEVEAFIDFMISKDKNQTKQHFTEEEIPKYGSNKNDGVVLTDQKETVEVPKRGFGSGKGIFGKMLDDFDELELERPKLKREFGGLKGKIWMSNDFDEPLEEFKDYM